MNMFLERPSGVRRSVSQHDVGCAGPRWAVQQRILAGGPLIAICRGCDAVRKVAEPEPAGA